VSVHVAQKTGGNAAVSSVAVRGSSGGWVPMNNVWGASWELGQAPPGPLDMQITDPSGDTVRTARECTGLVFES